MCNINHGLISFMFGTSSLSQCPQCGNYTYDSVEGKCHYAHCDEIASIDDGQYILSQDSMGDILYNLSEDSIIAANEPSVDEDLECCCKEHTDNRCCIHGDGTDGGISDEQAADNADNELYPENEVGAFDHLDDKLNERMRQFDNDEGYDEFVESMREW